MLAKDLGDDVTNVCFQLSNSWYIPSFFYGVGGTMFGPDGTDGSVPVSYTHLRAHETRHDLVCRLLLEKKKKSRMPSSA